MNPNEIQANVKRLHLLESSLLAQIKSVRQEKKQLVKRWYEQSVNHEEETPLEEAVKTAKK